MQLCAQHPYTHSVTEAAPTEAEAIAPLLPEVAEATAAATAVHHPEVAAATAAPRRETAAATAARHRETATPPPGTVQVPHHRVTTATIPPSADLQAQLLRLHHATAAPLRQHVLQADLPEPCTTHLIMTTTVAYTAPEHPPAPLTVAVTVPERRPPTEEATALALRAILPTDAAAIAVEPTETTGPAHPAIPAHPVTATLAPDIQVTCPPHTGPCIPHPTSTIPIITT